jgi:hypothetical protein
MDDLFLLVIVNMQVFALLETKYDFGLSCVGHSFNDVAFNIIKIRKLNHYGEICVANFDKVEAFVSPHSKFTFLICLIYGIDVTFHLPLWQLFSPHNSKCIEVYHTYFSLLLPADQVLLI